MTLMDVPKGVNDIKPQSYYINKFSAKNSCLSYFSTRYEAVLDSNRPLNS